MILAFWSQSRELPSNPKKAIALYIILIQGSTFTFGFDKKKPFHTVLVPYARYWSWVVQKLP